MFVVETPFFSEGGRDLLLPSAVTPFSAPAGGTRTPTPEPPAPPLEPAPAAAEPPPIGRTCCHRHSCLKACALPTTLALAMAALLTDCAGGVLPSVAAVAAGAGAGAGSGSSRVVLYGCGVHG